MSLIDDLLDRWEELRELGQPISAEELCREHPELLPELRRQIQALEAVSLQFGSARFQGERDEDTARWSPADQFELLNRFEIIKLHASGGLGNVYLAHDKVLDRPVAIKFLRRAELTKEQLDRFEWEAKITGRLEHPGIVPIHSMQESLDSTPCYVMRFINGLTLAQSVQSALDLDGSGSSRRYSQSAELQRLLRAFITVCNIVAYAHAQGVIHRDIKPGNIMLGPFGETLLLDWGIAKHVDQAKLESLSSQDRPSPTNPLLNSKQLGQISSLDSPTYTATGQAIGTPAFASPEQMQGLAIASHPTTDIFSLGATLHFILSGKAPFEMFGWSDYLNRWIAADSQLASQLPSEVPKELRAICNKAMRTQARDRYLTALDLATDIENYLSREPVSVLRDPCYARLARAARKRPGITGGVFTAIIVIMIATLISFAIVEAKNQRLTQTTLALNKSLEKTQQSNQKSIESLRQIFDDVIIRYFGQSEVMNEQDQAYLDKIIERYEGLDRLQDDRISSRVFRAEINYRMGRLFYQLNSKDRDPLAFVRLSSQLYQDLCHRDAQWMHADDYLESLRLQSEIEIEHSKDVDAALATAKRCLQEIERVGALAPNGTLKNVLETQASLNAILAVCYDKKSDWRLAYDYAGQAVSGYESLLSSHPAEPRFLHKLSAELARLAELAEHAEAACTPEAQLRYANQSVALSKQHLQLQPKHANSYLGLSWSYHARSLSQLRNGKTSESLRDLDQAIACIESLREKYQSQRFDRSVVAYRLRKVKTLQSVRSWNEIALEVNRLRRLSLNQEALGVCIESLEQYREYFPEDRIQRFFLAEMYSRRARLRTMDGNKGSLSDHQSAVELLEQIVLEDSDPLFDSRLIQALLSAAKDQHKFGNAAESEGLLQQAEFLFSNLQGVDPTLFDAIHLEILDLRLEGSPIRDALPK